MYDSVRTFSSLGCRNYSFVSQASSQWPSLWAQSLAARMQRKLLPSDAPPGAATSCCSADHARLSIHSWSARRQVCFIHIWLFHAVATGLAVAADCRHLFALFSTVLPRFAVEAPARPTDTAANVEGGRQTPSYVSLSDKYAIVDAAGTQMLLEEGRWYTCNRLQVGVRLERNRVLLRLCSMLCAQFSCHCRLNQAAQSSLAEFLHPKKMAHFQVADHTWKMSLWRQRYWKSSRGRR